MSRGRASSRAASPTMVGAITTLIVIVAVFLAYNASNGLPFVPVYRISVELPNAQRLAPNNEVRIGGSRVGIIESIEPKQNPNPDNGAPPVVAKVDLKLDKSVDPLPRDTQVRVRYKSSFGLKYLELTRGHGKPLHEGATIPVTHSTLQTEFDDISNTFDRPTREASRQVLIGFGGAFASRGAALNETIQNLNPLFAYLKPVARVLTAPETRLDRFFPALARTAALVAPVSDQNAENFANMSATFAALSSDPEALKDAISSGVPTLAQGTVALREQRPFLVDFADLSRRLRPGVNALHAALPTLNDALTVGAPVLRRMPPVNAELGRVFRQLNRLVSQPETKTTLLRLRETFDQAAPAAKYIAPYQTVCDYWNYWFTWLPEHISQKDNTGTTQRVSVIGVPSGPTGPLPGDVNAPLGGYSGLQANGIAGPVPIPTDNGRFKPRELPIVHGNPYAPAVDKNGNADCQAGQTGYVLGNYPLPGQSPNNPAFAISNIPGNRGTTFAGRPRLPGSLHPRKLP
ncbi:MAG TPA: MlaD family protein [Candidatus Polarisedimenticolia bacterium]|nr:MlaD family protein [Candidatus Polarisedimenticolia bacterium]